jgi:hypothetical protein
VDLPRPWQFPRGRVRSRAPARLSLAAAHPALSGSCSEIDLETCFKDAGLAPAEPLPVARDLGDTSLMFLVHPTITPKQMARLAVDCSPRPARPRWRSESGSDRGARWRIGASGAGRALPAAGSAGATPAGPAFGAGAAADSLSPHTSATALNHWAALAAVARGLRHRDPDHGPLRRLWPALPWLVVASRFSQTHRHLPAPASTASSSATPCAPDRCPQAGRLRGVGLRPRESRLNVDREREPTARRAQRQAQCNLVQLRHQLEPSDPTPNASEM